MEAESSIMQKMSDMLDKKIDGLKRSFMSEQQSLSAKLDKRLKTSEKTFKKKSSRVQYELNTDIKDKIGEAKSEMVKKTNEGVDKAYDILEEGISILSERNKFIEMANTSEHGWATIEEYIQRSVADDSDDDKRIRRAEVSVGRKKELKKKPANSFRGRNIPVRNTYSQDQYYGGYGHGGYGGYPYNPQPFRGGRGRGSFPRRGYQWDICFTCGQRGHWKTACPLNGGPGDSGYNNNYGYSRGQDAPAN